MTHLLDRYDELASLRLSDSRRLQALTRQQGKVILALDGLQPDVGHEVLWVLRDCLSGEVLLARSLLSSTEQDLAGLIEEVKQSLSVPIEGAVSDGQHSIRNAVASALPGIPHPWCHFHDLREAGRPLYEQASALTPLSVRARDHSPRRNSRSAFGASARSSARWSGARMPGLTRSAAIALRFGQPSRTTAARSLPPRSARLTPCGPAG